MDNQAEIRRLLADLTTSASAGYAIALHIRYTTPLFLFQTYPKDWIAHYSQKGLVMQDPIVAWSFSNLGTIRWSELAKDDAAGVLIEARKFNMNFGFACAIEIDDSRSMAGFARSDREFTDAEIEFIVETTSTLHVLTEEAGTLNPQTRDALRKLSIQFTHPPSA
jgi:LuxR family transcriptional regulator